MQKFWKRRSLRAAAANQGKCREHASQGASPFLQLHDDCLIDVLCHLHSPKDVLSLRRTCRRMSVLSRQYCVWVAQLVRLQNRFDNLYCRFQTLDRDASELERLVSAHLRFKKRLEQHNPFPLKAASFSHESHTQVERGFCSPCTTLCSSCDVLLTAAFISPGLLLTGTRVLQHPPSIPQGRLKLWQTDIKSVKEVPLNIPLAEYDVATSSVDGIYVECDPVEENAYLVLVGDRRNSATWELLRLRCPDIQRADFCFEKIGMIKIAIINGVSVKGELVVFSCVLPQEGIRIWHWPSDRQIFVPSKDCNNPLLFTPDFDNGRVLIMHPYVAVLNHVRGCLQIYDISDPFAKSERSVESWVRPLPIRTGDAAELKAMPDGGIEVDFWSPENHKAFRCSMQVRSNVEEAQLPFETTFSATPEVRAEFNAVGIRGAKDFLTPTEVNKVLDYVLPKPHEMYVDIFRSVTLDCFLGRLCVIENNVLHLYDFI